ncbi:hypothetical protein HU200_061607 [Digitaria exilis]|uniref:Uncharacterized protein n=1 Tax=Digitaria exilis TaxID=1010633 RepID=A0A835A851_9POAL|nr:hypothetical protein HU200_061607 [Digitaria exilis]
MGARACSWREAKGYGTMQRRTHVVHRSKMPQRGFVRHVGEAMNTFLSENITVSKLITINSKHFTHLMDDEYDMYRCSDYTVEVNKSNLRKKMERVSSTTLYQTYTLQTT